jgi:PTS system glucitol/sorbitol-specific IIC component
MYHAIKISKGTSGWGGPLIISLTDKKNKIVSVTGGGIDPITLKIAEMTGGTAVDGFTSGVPDEEIAVVVVDCGGTARCGVYPKKRVPTVNLTPVGQSGPLAKFITEDIYVSGVKESNLERYEGDAPETSGPRTAEPAKAEPKASDIFRGAQCGLKTFKTGQIPH